MNKSLGPVTQPIHRAFIGLLFVWLLLACATFLMILAFGAGKANANEILPLVKPVREFAAADIQTFISSPVRKQYSHFQPFQHHNRITNMNPPSGNLQVTQHFTDLMLLHKIALIIFYNKQAY